MVKALLAGNKRPTEAQEAEIRQAIPRLREQVLKIEREFNEVDISLAIIPPEQTPDVQLTEQFAQLKLRLDNAKDRLADHMRSLTYGRQVPVEVLELIFRFCLPRTDYVVPNPLQAPLLLCQICSAWRRVALVTPLLWCSLSVHLSRRPGAWKAFLDSWLGRSGQTPISLSFAGDSNANYSYFNDHILKVLLKGSKRWRRLRLEVPSSTLTKLLNTSMPLLESLEIGTRDRFPGVFLSSADAPRLRSLTLLGDKTDPTHIHLPWDRLTQFHVAKVAQDLDKCFSLLAKCKNLTRLTVQPSGTTVSQASEILPLRLARLRSLVVIGSIAAPTFFAHVELPSLNKLELVSRGGEPFDLKPESSIVSLARRSNLRSLCLTGGWPVDGLFDAVVAIPSLKEVVLGSGESLPPAVQEALDMRK